MNLKATEFIDKMGAFFESLGLDRASGRVLGFLFISAPDDKSATDIVNALEMSRGAVSMAARGLQARGYVEIRGEPGSRKKYYRLCQQAWTIGIADRARAFGQFAEITDFGLKNVPGIGRAARRQLKEVRDFYLFLEERFPLLIDEWEKSKKRRPR